MKVFGRWYCSTDRAALLPSVESGAGGELSPARARKYEMNFFSIVRSAPLALFALCFIGLTAAAVPEASAQSARIDMKIISGGLVIGATGGKGTLYFEGNAYPVRIGGLSIGFTLGIKAADVAGEVFNLRQPSDINGTYVSIGAGATLGAGATVATMVNGKGVQLTLRMVQVGLGYSLDLGGLNILLR